MQTLLPIAGIFVAIGSLAYVVSTPPSGEHFTEFYVLGPGGNASDYPTHLNASQPGSVILGIANHESATVNYTIGVELVGVRLVYNSTTRQNQTVEVNRTTWTWMNVTVAVGQN